MESSHEIISLYNIPIKLKSYYKSYPVNIKNINIPENRISISIILFVVFLISEIIVKIFFGSIGFIISYQIYYTYGSRTSGDNTWGMIITKNIHIHHWIYCFVLLISVWISGIGHPFIIGLCSGGITHGIQFPDWHIIYIKE
jgi:hypothetical protein